MANDMTKWIGSKVSAESSLSIQACVHSHERRKNTAQACKRFLQAAALLRTQEFLGWQIRTEENGPHRITAFSSANAKASPEDYGWIFSQCASAGDAPQAPLGDLREGCRWVYALWVTALAPKAVRTQEEDEYDEYDNGAPAETASFDPLQDLWKELKKSKVIIRILAKSEPDAACGIVLISLPSEITLRMQTMISLAFPDLSATPINVLEKACVGIDRIGPKHLTRVMSGLLDVLMAEQAGQKTADACSPAASGDNISIEELDLSVRAFNCLKRAGINTVGQLRTMTDDDFAHVRNLGRKCTEEIRTKLAEWETQTAPALQTASGCRETLDELVGLQQVKAQVKRISAFAKLKRDMAAQNKATLPIALNMEFTGNPGTAKTTVARILAGAFHEIGLLPGNGLVEVGRADLVGRYVGHTADQVKSVFERAKGKVLFIDEAYSLVDHYENGFGDEAINTIVQEMENNRENTIVIFAGYPDKMKDFFGRNPGLRSRVPFQIHFDDYSVDEMVQIVELEAKRRGFSIRPDARTQIGSICETAVNGSDAGNGRFCRNLVEDAILNYSVRVYAQEEAPAQALVQKEVPAQEPVQKEAPAQNLVLEKADFSLPEGLQKTERPLPMGFAR